MLSKHELEQVISFGYLEKDFEIVGFQVKMRTLAGGETEDIAKELSGLDDIATFRGLQIKTLSHSIIAINGKPIQYIPESEQDIITEFKKIEQNEKIIRKWQKVVIEYFYEKYREMEAEQSDFLSQYKKQSKKAGVEKNGDWGKLQDSTKSLR